MRSSTWLIHHNMMMQNNMMLLNHNDASMTIFELAIAIVISLAIAGCAFFFLEGKIKESILSIIIGLSSSVWLFSLSNVSSSTDC